MSQFRPLIKGQEIGIDDQSRGRGTEWDTGLHIHKWFTDKNNSRKGFEILVLVDQDDEIEIRPGCYAGEREYPTVRKEIQKALKKGQKRTEFVEDIANAIGRFSRGERTFGTFVLRALSGRQTQIIPYVIRSDRAYRRHLA